ncbi:MAG: YceI family protein [Syntrophales bacterium]
MIKINKLAIIAALILFVPVHIAAAQQQGWGNRRFDFVPQESRIVFGAASTLHSFHGRANDAEGFAEGEMEHLGETATGVLKVAVKSMTTDHKARDAAMLESLEAEKYPFILFFVKHIAISSLSENKLKARTVLTGELNLHGIKKVIEMPAEVTWAYPKIYIKGRKELSLKDFSINPASFLFVKVKDKVVVEFDMVGKEKAFSQ